MQNRWTCVNGKLLPTEEALLPVEDRALQFGDGVYEVIRLYRGTPFALKQHLARLSASSAAIMLDYGCVENELQASLEAILQKASGQDGQIYIQVTRGTAIRNHRFPEHTRPNVICTFSPLPAKNAIQLLKTVTLPDERWMHCNIKATSLLPNILAKEKAYRHGADEAILYRSSEHITEGSSSNIFMVQSGTIITHPANQWILNGITRQYVLALAKSLQIPYEERVFSLQELLNADEVIVTSTLQEIAAVVEIDHHPVQNGCAGPLTRRLHEEFMGSLSTEWFWEHAI
ncbi:D-amino-acid transaminase [Alicyclobacillus sp. TC]|uniref:D-amino-acid transaminase n=1 Tax=Alicyclobacillus sp. TC TaxID=2606450 RepID=UPI001931A57A|nr:D-amino-acid transaminase [Alicyclobacillus sp. TC]